MGEKKSATKRLLEKYAYCCLCGGGVKANTREHVPPKALFDRSHRPNQMVVPACSACNEGTRTGDTVAAIVARWGFSEPTTAEREDSQRLIRGIANNHPDIQLEWLQNSGSVSQRQARRHLASYGAPIPNEAKFITIGPATLPYLNQFALKLTLGIYFEQTLRCFPSTGLFRAFLRFKEDFRGTGLPQKIIDIAGDPLALAQGAWNTREQFEYRAKYNPENGLFIHASRLRMGLFIVGMASEDRSVLPNELIADWISPGPLSKILDDPHYRDKL
ncbi:conserved hypothetical protein [Methylocella tundrae]|uniref:HNH endonuclease n=1 Tax=Methylocella tundrae TaxID=227605 RepID=A0A8B6M216_METTU|nr:hypothetical protein [Methylocella tundrae]VTZ22345.1 conserved hypothetical protein [Methylocella tundrae]VTZ49057.1 conserved hypothetical protein [Methylocella tundrae]